MSVKLVVTPVTKMPHALTFMVTIHVSAKRDFQAMDEPAQVRPGFRVPCQMSRVFI